MNIIKVFSFFTLSLLFSLLNLNLLAQEEVGFDQKIDEVFGAATEDFVSFIFYEIPFGSVNEQITVDALSANHNLDFDEKSNAFVISNIKLTTNHIGEEVKVLSSSIKKFNIEKGKIEIHNADYIEDYKFTVDVFSPYFKIYWVLFPLILGALFFTIYFKVPGVRLFMIAINTVRGKYEHVEEMPSDLNVVDGDEVDTIRVEGEEGEVSHFQALTAALSATVGLGNIAGVAVAVAIGGPGATFWMILAGLLGMSSKFVECTLGVKYRDVDENGKVYGGPMYYLTKGLKEKGYAKLGKVLAVLFAIMCIGGSFGGGNMFQANQAASIFIEGIGAESEYAGTLFGIVMAIIVGIVIIGGIQRIATVTEKIVPFMAVVYVGAALIIIFMKLEFVPAAISAIMTGAFAPTAIAGGFLGVLVQGFRRAAFSNEAGIGSAAIAHSAVRTKHPASEGTVALLEPFIDTVVICTMTAIVIVLFNIDGAFPYGNIAGNAVFVDGKTLSGVGLTSFVFDSAIPNFSIVLTIAVILFAFSTMISWSYYGLQSWTFLFGKSIRNQQVYKILFCLFVVVGAAAKMDSVLAFSDAMIFAMMVPNMIGLFLLAPVVKEELSKYLAKIREKE